MPESSNNTAWLIRYLLPDKNRKGVITFYCLLAIVGLAIAGKMTPEAQYGITFLLGIFVGGNSFEHNAKKGKATPPPEEKAE
jgi:hypothetical protein